jgi:hypothetical protein
MSAMPPCSARMWCASRWWRWSSAALVQLERLLQLGRASPSVGRRPANRAACRRHPRAKGPGPAGAGARRGTKASSRSPAAATARAHELMRSASGSITSVMSRHTWQATTFHRTLSTCLRRAFSSWILRASVMPAIGASSSTFAPMRRSASQPGVAAADRAVLTRPVGRPPKKPVVTFTSFRY